MKHSYFKLTKLSNMLTSGIPICHWR